MRQGATARMEERSDAWLSVLVVGNARLKQPWACPDVSVAWAW